MLHPPHCLAVITAALLTTLTIAGCQSSVRSTTATSAASSSDDALTGTEGTADFDVGFVTIGSGHKVVDVFIDPMCSFCKHFEETSGEKLFSDAAAGQGTSYFARAAAYLTVIAAEHPAAMQAFLQALLRKQPQENTLGLTDADLTRHVQFVGADLDFSEAHVTPYKVWADEQTDLATSGALEASTQIPAIQQVPTVNVNGAVFAGSIYDTDAFASFYASR